ncbi:MAG: LuxR C-terminal-related transcriptional regulator [Flavobacteriaceae bacterium]
MKSNKELVTDIWKSHHNYLADKSEVLQTAHIENYFANLFCPGPFYYYVIDSPTLTLDIVSDSVEHILGIKPQDFTIETFVNNLHPEDLGFFMRCEDLVAWFLKNKVPTEKMVRYKINYCFRQRVADGTFRLFLIQTITMSTTDEGALLKVFGSQTDINHITTVNNYKMSLIGLNGEPSFLDIDVFSDDAFEHFVPYDYEATSPDFTKRELEVIKLLAQGLATEAIAAELHISGQTVYTHRKNILRKSGLKNTTELIAACIRRGYV